MPAKHQIFHMRWCWSCTRWCWHCSLDDLTKWYGQTETGELQSSQKNLTTNREDLFAYLSGWCGLYVLFTVYHVNVYHVYIYIYHYIKGQKHIYIYIHVIYIYIYTYTFTYYISYIIYIHHLISSHFPNIRPRSNAKVDCHALAFSQALITLPNAMISVRCPCRWILV